MLNSGCLLTMATALTCRCLVARACSLREPLRLPVICRKRRLSLPSLFFAGLVIDLRVRAPRQPFAWVYFAWCTRSGLDGLLAWR